MHAQPRPCLLSLCLLSLLVFLTAALVAPASIFAAEDTTTFTHPEFKFTVSYPKEFEQAPSPSPQAALVLRHRERGFPTFTVTLHPGPFIPGERHDQKEREVLASYRAVGITDARLIASHQEGERGLVVEIGFSQGGESRRSQVTLLSGTAQHYILTYIDRETSWSASEPLRNALTRSFIPGPDYTPPPSPKKRVDFSSLLFPITALILCIVFLLRYQGRSSAGGRSQ